MTDMNNDKKTAGAAPDPQAAPPASPKTDPKRPAARPPQEEKPVRRVGSITLGLCLIAVGVCFLLYYFAPGFNWLLVAKVGAPLALVALGVEVIWCAAHPARWKYDFLAVFGCLVLMGGAFCLTLLPLFWQQVSPERRIQLEGLTDQYEGALYDAVVENAPSVQLDSMDVYIDNDYGVDLPVGIQDLDNTGIRFFVNVDLYGDFSGQDGVASFAQSAYEVVQAMREIGPLPDKAEFYWENARETISYSLSLRGQAQMDWTAEQMAEQTRVWLDTSDDAVETYPAEDLAQENVSGNETAPAEPEAPAAPEAPAPSDVVQAAPAAADVPEAPEVVSARPVMPVIQFRMD